ncbi:hypothetical protein [Streptomyces sp. NPDC050585]|uniref:hypothetical protein n=1 Tax=Streptomyces sp. NPDC050585 TaxID=3365632 RepID=UPI0037A64C6A
MTDSQNGATGKASCVVLVLIATVALMVYVGVTDETPEGRQDCVDSLTLGDDDVTAGDHIYASQVCEGHGY